MSLTPDGLSIPTVEDLEDQIVADQRLVFGPDVETGPFSPLGQLTGIVASALREVRELLVAVYASFDPDSARGAALDRVSALTGTLRRPATRSRVAVDVEVEDGTSLAPGDLILSVQGAPTRRFANTVAIENATGMNQVISVQFESEVTGPVEAPAGTLTVLAQSAGGFVSATNPDPARLGLPRETDAQLRLRREQEISRLGTGTVDAIRVDVLDAVVDEAGMRLLVDVIVFENTSNVTSPEGLPPHSIEVMCYDGTPSGTIAPSADIALAVWRAKPAGIETFGTETETVMDARGDDRQVSFSRPIDAPIQIEVTVQAGPAFTAGSEGAITDALVEFVRDIGIGRDLVLSRLYCPILDAVNVPEEVYSVTLLRASLVGDPLVAADVIAGPRDLLSLDAADVIVLTV